MDSNHKNILKNIKIILRKNICKNLNLHYNINLPTHKIKFYNLPVPKQLYNDCGYHAIIICKFCMFKNIKQFRCQCLKIFKNIYSNKIC